MALAAGFASVFVFSSPAQSPDPEVTGLIAIAGAVVYLFRPRYAWLAMVLGGALAGMLVQLVGLIGAPLMLTLPLIAAAVAVIAWIARTRPVAVLPSVLDGWQAAGNLNVQAENVAREAIPPWTLTVVATSMLLGAAHALWSRR